MAKYKKNKESANKRKRKEFSTALPKTSEMLSYLDTMALGEYQRKVQDALELERDEIVGRAWHNHHQQEEARQYRNGYGNPRCLTCGSGTIQLQMPRLRKAFDSKIVQKYERMTDAMKRLIPELYLHGLATGDFEYAFGWLLGENAPLSSSSIVRMKDKWQSEYEQWKGQKLEEEYLYIWADGIYPKGGPIDETLALLVVLGVNRQGQKKLLAIEEGYRESEESWTEVFRNLKRRGVQWIGLIVGDGIAGLWKAARNIFSVALHQRCWVHKMRNILDNVPGKAHDEVLDFLRRIYYSSSYAESQRLKKEFINRYNRLYPKAVKSLLEAGDKLFSYFQFPDQHWKSIKTTNPIESLFATVKLRTAAARRLRSRMSTVCLVFQLLRVSERRLNKLRSYKSIPNIIDQLRKNKNLSKVRYAA